MHSFNQAPEGLTRLGDHQEDSWWARLPAVPRELLVPPIANLPATASPTARPSQRWIDSIFDSEPSRNVRGRSRPTQRFAYSSDACRGRLVHCEGGNELTAALLLEHLWRIGIVRRFKMQPFSLSELGYPTSPVPDILVELVDSRVVSIEVKAAKYLTSQRRAKFETEREFLAQHSLPHLLWTDDRQLSRATWHAVRHLQRGAALNVDASTKRDLAQSLPASKTLGDLMALPSGSWDQLMAAAARGYFHLNPQEKFSEQARIYPAVPSYLFAHFFDERYEPASWFDALEDCKDQQWPTIAA